MARAKGVGGIRCQGISKFNTSLLGKQYWRMPTNEDSLLGSEFKMASEFARIICVRRENLTSSRGLRGV